LSKPDYAAAFLRGVDHFNALEFWESHEAWEELWLVAESDVEQFLQGLIQIAAAYHHMKRGTFRGAVRLFEAGLRRLEPFPAGFSGLDRREVTAAACSHRQDAIARRSLVAGAYPKLRLLASEDFPMPPRETW
jgi:predicted metal-dependent hydrolase